MRNETKTKRNEAMGAKKRYESQRQRERKSDKDKCTKVAKKNNATCKRQAKTCKYFSNDKSLQKKKKQNRKKIK